MPLTTAQVQQAYVTFFSRPADTAGLTYWTSLSTLSLEALYTAFSGSSEYTSAFSGLNNGARVNLVYNNLFGRDADVTGLTYWTLKLDQGALSLSNLALALGAGAQGTDATTLANRVTAATAYTNALDTNAEILGYSGATANAAAKAWLGGITDAASLAAATAPAALASTVASTTSAVGTVVGSTFVLTTSVDAVSGGANNDTITGVIGSSGTYTVGDNIMGGSGTDTLNLIDDDATAAGLVSLDGVETVNVRLLSGAGQTELNAADWSGVATLTNASSLAEATLDVSGLADSTTVVLYGNTDINIGFDNTTTGATANAVLVNAGSAGTATTIGSAAGTTNTANFDFDEANGGLVTHVNLEVRGSLNLARLDGDGSGMTYTISGTGNAALISNDNISTFNASAANGNIDMTFEGVSDVAFTGGGGNDTVRLGATISNGDSVNGGAGSDTVTLTMGAFGRTLNATAVETLTLTFNEGDATLSLASASTPVTTINLSTGSAGSDASVAGIGGGAVVNARTDNYDAVTIDFASGALTGTVNIGSAGTATADVVYSGLYITDVAAVTVAVVSMASNGATANITTATFNTDVKSIVFETRGGSGALEIGDGGNASIGGATAITFNANSAANINFDSNIAGGATLTTLSVNTLGGESGSADLEAISGTAITAITLNASGAGDIDIGAVSLGNGSKTGEAAAITLNVNQGIEADVTVGAITTTGGATLTINATAIQSSGSFYIADVIFNKGDDGSTTGLTQNFVLSAVNVGTGGSFEIEGIDFEAATAGAQITIGNILVQNGGAFDLGSAVGISAEDVANVDVSNINVTIQGSGSATFGVIETTGGLIGAITLNVGTAASATFGTMTASGVGAITVMVTGSTAASAAGVDFGNISSETTVGAIEIAGVDGANVTFGTIGASGSLGAIAVSGAVDVVIGAVTTTRVGTISTTGQNASGSFTIDLSGVTNAVEVNLGIGTNAIISGAGNDVFTLTGGRTAAAGNDTITFTTATQGVDNIINFIGGAAASGGDKIAFGTALNSRIIAGSARVTDLTTVVTELATTASGAITIASAASVVLIGATAFASIAALHSAIATGGSLEINMVGAGSATAGSLVVVWTDGADSYISLVAVEATAGTNALVSGVANIQTVAQITGVTPGALVAANFDFV